MEPDKKLEEASSQESETKPETGLSLFIRIGIVILSILLITGFGIKVLPRAVSVSTSGSKRMMPIYSVDTVEKKVSLSFDVASGDDDIPLLLSALDQYKVRATFFMTGEWISKYPEEVKDIAVAGHDLGNYGEAHKQLSKLTRKECSEEIMSVHDKVKTLTGIEMNLFRAPYGDFNDLLLQTAKECGYDTIEWNVDSLDWKDYGTRNIINEIMDNKNLGNGSIILMHSGTKYTSQALGAVIKSLQDQGYRIVPVSQLIYTGDYVVDQEGRQFRR